MNHRLYFLLLILFLPPVSFGASLKQVPIPIQNQNDQWWIPNTDALDGRTAIRYKGYFYLALNGGLGEFNALRRSLFVYPLPLPEKLDGSWNFPSVISNVVIVKDRFWVVTFQNGIWIFNPESRKFEGQVPVKEFLPGFDPRNLQAKMDRQTHVLWLTGFGCSASYDLAKDHWEDLKKIFLKLGLRGQGSSDLVIPTKRYVWIVAGAHEKANGGLLRFDKQNAKWTVIRDEVFPTPYPPRIDIGDVLVSEDYLWVLYGGLVFQWERKTDHWSSYRYWDLLTVAENVRSQIPRLKTRPFALGFWRAFNEFAPSGKDYERHIRDFPLDEEKMRNILKLFDSMKVYLSGDFEEDQTFENQIETRDAEGMIDNHLSYLAEPRTYFSPLCELKSGVLLSTNHGLDVLNIEKKTLGHVPDSESFFKWENPAVQIIKIGKMIFLNQAVSRESDMPMPASRIFSLDLKSMKFNKISTKKMTDNQVIWSEADVLYVNTRCDGTLKWNGKRWDETPARVAPDFDFSKPSKTLRLKDGRTLNLEFDGLYLKN